jgi:hypothetical protein
MSPSDNLLLGIECRACGVYIDPMEMIAAMALSTDYDDYYWEPLQEKFTLRDGSETKVFSEYASGDSFSGLCNGVKQHISAVAKPFPYSLAYDDSNVKSMGNDSMCPLYGSPTSLSDPKRSQEEYIHHVGFAPVLSVSLISEYLFYLCTEIFYS